MSDPARKLENLRDRIEQADLSEQDSDILEEFDKELSLRAHEYSVVRRVKLLQHAFITARETGRLADSLEDREAAEDIVRWINDNYDNEETNHDYRVALRVFGKYLADGPDEVPETMAWISGTTSKSYNPTPNPGEMLKWDEDVSPMIDACRNDRDRAMIAVAWDLGARSGEFRNIHVGDLSDSKYGLKVHLDGKTGQRSPTLIPSVPYLQQWLNKHPRRDDDNAPLWCKLETGEDISYQMIRKILNTAAKRAGVTKPVTLTNFRKSSASYKASQGVSQSHLEKHHGWTTGSSAAARYIAIFGEAAEREIARAHGIEVEEDDTTPTHTPVECPRCGKQSPHDEDFCMWCHQALEPEAIEQIREETRDVRAQLLRMVTENPNLLGEIESMEDIIELLDTRPESIDDARTFLDALGD